MRHRWHLRHPLQDATASWFDGSQFAWGTDRGHYGVANLTLAHHTKVRLCHDGCVIAEVVDRGPYVAGRMWDLLPETKAAIGCSDLCDVRWRLAWPG